MLTPRFTSREWQVARLVAERYSNAEIARRLGLTVNTVSGYVRTAASKLPEDGRRQRDRIRAFLAAA